MRAEKLLPVATRPSDEVVPTKGWPCGAGVAAEVGAISGILVHRRATVVFDP